MYDPTHPLTADIPLNDRGDPWESRPSDADLREPGAYHNRQDSFGSVDTVMGDKVQQPRYSGYGQNTYPPVQPGAAYTQDPTPTPQAQDPYYYQAGYTGGNGMDQPERTQPHPGAS